MRTVSTIARNAGSLVTAEIVSRIIHFLFFVYIARILGDTKLGVLGFATSFVNLFAVIPRFGFNVLTVRDVSRDPRKGSQYFTNIVIIKSMLSVITLALIIIISLFIDSIREYRLILYIVAVTMIAISFSDFTYSLYRALQQMQWEAIIRSVTVVLAGFVGAIAVYIGWDLIGYVSTSMFVYILSVIIATIFLFMKFYTFHLHYDKILCRFLIINSVPFILLSIFTTINLQISTVMVSLMKNFQVTGWYNASYKFFLTLTFIPTSFASAILPALSKTYPDNINNFVKIYSHTIRWLFIIAVPFTILMSMRATDIILFIYGSTFVNSAPALAILIFSLLFSFLSPVVGSVLIAANHHKYPVIAAVVSACANIILNMVLITSLSYIGASIALVITHIINFVIQKFYVDKHVVKVKILPVIVRPIFAAGIFAFIMYLMRDLAIFPVSFVAVIVYIMVLLITRSVSKEDLIVIKNALAVSKK